MKVRELIEQLNQYNPEADVDVTAHNQPQEFSICYGSSEGCTKENCESITLYVDALNDSEQVFVERAKQALSR